MEGGDLYSEDNTASTEKGQKVPATLTGTGSQGLAGSMGAKTSSA